MRVRSENDYLASPLDLRLAAPALVLWFALLGASFFQLQGLAASLAIASLSGAVTLCALLWLRFNSARIRVSRHRIFPRGSPCALLGLTAATLAAAFGAHALILDISGRDPLVALGAGSTHRFDVCAQVVTTPRSSTFVPDRYQVDIRVRQFSWHAKLFNSNAKLQVRGTGWGKVPAGSWVRLRLGISRIDPSGQYTAFAKGPTKPQVVSSPTGRYRFIHHVRRLLNQGSASLPTDVKSLVKAMTLGSTWEQTDADRQALKTSGLAHLTAISGMHLSVLLGLALGLTSRYRRWIQVSTAASLALLFLAMLEGSSSVTRAAIMGGISLMSLGLARPSRSLTALFGAIIGMLVAMPWQATSWGFALSVAATGSIVTLGRFLAETLSTFLPRVLAFPLSVALAAQLGCAPLMLIMRGKLQVYSLPANLLTTAISSLVTVGGLALIALTALHLPLQLPLFIAGAAAFWVLHVARFFAGLRGAEVPWIEETALGVLGLILITVCFLWLSWRYARRRRWRSDTLEAPSPPERSPGRVQPP